jgi:hypothetical protein
MNNNLEFENTDPSPDSIEDNHPRTNYGEGYYEEPRKETLEEAAESRYGTDMDSIRGSNVYDLNTDLKKGFIEGAKWMKTELEEVSERLYPFAFGGIGNSENDKKNHFVKGAKYMAERMYSDIELFTEELKDKIDSFEYSVNQQSYIQEYITKWFEQFKKK